VSYKRGLAVMIGSVVAALVSYAATYPRFHPEETPGAAPSAPASGASVENSIATAFTPLPGHNDPLAWAHLSDAQRSALAPFATEWDKFSDERRRKWLKIAARYPKMSPDAQKRLQDRMSEWVRMTPEQRRVARETYQASKELPPQARQRAWKDYQQLSPEQKERLAATEHKRRTVVSAPPTGTKSEIRDIERLVDERDRRSETHSPAAAGHAASGAVPASGTGAMNAPVPATAGIPSAASFVPATPIPVSPAEAPAAYKGS
jgi:FAD/FMN-containing dehydrogenase